MRVTAVFPTYKNPIKLYRAVASMAKYSPCNDVEVMVIDNDPDLSGLKALAVAYKGPLHPIVGDNTNFQQYMSQVIEKTVETSYVALMNDDVLFVPGQGRFWDNLMWVAGHESVGAVGPRTNVGFSNQRLQQLNCPRLCKTSVLNQCCILMKTQRFVDLGGMAGDMRDGQDWELCMHLWLNGLDLVVHGDTYLHHEGSQTSVRDWGEHWHSLNECNEEIENDLVRKHGVRNYAQWRDSMVSWFNPETGCCEGKVEEWLP